MKPQFPHRTIGIEPRSRKDLVAAPHSLQGGHFAPVAIAVTGSGINVESFLCLLRKTLRSNCHEGNRESPHARTYSVLADCYDAEGNAGAIVNRVTIRLRTWFHTGSAARKCLNYFGESECRRLSH